MAEDPQNANGISSFSWLLFENGEAEKAYEVVRRATWGISCYADNFILFMRGRELAEYVGKEEESKWYRQQLDEFEESGKKHNAGGEIPFGEYIGPKQLPLVKEQKIYPNDPCPCGSGRKYKKCCGKR